MKTYEKSLKTYRDNYSVLKTAMDEGVEMGVSKGELKKAVEIAEKMKLYGDPLKKIEAMTGLSKEQIEKL